MTKSIFFIFLLIIGLSASAQEKTISSKVRDVTVFLNNAVITHTANASLSKGTSRLKIKGFPSNIDQNSIQVAGKGAFTILSVAFEKDYMSPQTEALQEALRHLERQMEDLKLENNILAKEEDMLMDNSEIGSEEEGVNIEKLKIMQTYFRESLRSIATQKLQNTRSIEKLKIEKSNTEKQLEFSKRDASPLGVVTLKVKANTATKASLEVSYVAYNCSWSPNYDLRVSNTDAPALISYKAKVFQNTGIDWEDVNLTLSTTNPNKGTQKPQLGTQYLDFYNKAPVALRSYNGQDRAKVMAAVPLVEQKNEETMDMASNYVQSVDASLALEFKIDLPYSITSNKQSEEVEINKISLPASYQYHLVPKYDKEAFLIATLRDFEPYSFLPGQMNVYFEGAYVGKAYMPRLETKDELEVSLGRDSRIISKRVELTDYKSKQTFGGNIRQDFQYRIEVKNNGPKSISINVQDQYPISKSSEIEVSLKAPLAQKDKEKGFLKWEFQVSPGAVESRTFGYEVKYPKDKNISNL